MTKSELRQLIKNTLIAKYKKEPSTDVSQEPLEYDQLTKFPELKQVIVQLLTSNYDSFLASIDWVAPRPTMFRINLKNDHDFYLTWNERSWIAQIEGKKYYILNLPEEQRALEALSRLLMYGAKEKKEEVEETPEESTEESPLDNMDKEAEPETEEQ